MFENELAETVSLNGTWQFEIAGQTGTIRVPGAWEAQGYAPEPRSTAAVNEPAVYRRTFEVPAAWADADIWLQFGAVSYYAEVLVNGVAVGTHEGMWTPFEFEVTHAVKPGETNTLEVRVTKPGYAGDRFPYRDVLVGFLPYVSDTFGGIWQDVTLLAHQMRNTFQIVTVLADAETEKVEVGCLTPDTYEWHGLTATITNSSGQIVAQTHDACTMGMNQLSLHIENPERWSPEQPGLYKLTLEMGREGQDVARTTRRFGFRKLHSAGEAGDQLMLNGAAAHLRGALSWGWDPKTLAPMPSDDEVRDEFRRVRELGFNMIKLCLFVPPENVFRIADEEGMLLWLELPLWLPNLSDHLREQARIEYGDIMQRVHHHPSVVIYSLGCELGAEMADAALLDNLNDIVRGSTRGALVCDNSGSGEAFAGLNFDYSDFNDYHFYTDLHYFSPLLDLFRRDWRPPRPLIFGEFCDCDDYRDPADLLVEGERAAWRNYYGIEGNPTRWDWVEQDALMAAVRVREGAKFPFSDAQIAEVSRKQSFVVRKTVLELTRARRGMGGYVVTGLRDTPASTAGMFDDNGRAKYDADEFRLFNSDAVLMLEQGRSRRWIHGGDRPYVQDLHNHRSGEMASFRIVLAHTGQTFEAGELAWRLTPPQGSAGAVLSGSVSVGKRSGSPCELARVEFTLPTVERAEQWEFEVELEGRLRNHWHLWIYPTQPELKVAIYDPAGVLPLNDLPRADLASDGIVIAGAYTPELDAYLRAGGKAVLIQLGEHRGGGLPMQAVPFWRESIKLMCDHPIMRAFPHEGYADLQFYHVATDHAFDTTALHDMDVTPVMRRLDARLFHVLDYVVDVQVGKGRMIATTLRLFGGAGDQAQGEANVAGEYLLKVMVGALAEG